MEKRNIENTNYVQQNTQNLNLYNDVNYTKRVMQIQRKHNSGSSNNNTSRYHLAIEKRNNVNVNYVQQNKSENLNIYNNVDYTKRVMQILNLQSKGSSNNNNPRLHSTIEKKNIENTNYVQHNISQNLTRYNDINFTSSVVQTHGQQEEDLSTNTALLYKRYFNKEKNTEQPILQSEKLQYDYQNLNKINLQTFKKFNFNKNKQNQGGNCSVDLNDSTNKSTIIPKINQPVYNKHQIRNYPVQSFTEVDTELFDKPADLNKLKTFTAIDFNRDRYARYTIHESEIKDYVRTITFKNCFKMCAENHIKDKVVLVVRCGIGLIPMLCIRYGSAKKVIALEQSACIEYARQIVIDNSYEDQITLIQSSVQDLKQLPHRLIQVDVIVSDFMGECLLSQGDQMEQVIEARDRFLKPNGIMIPKGVSLYGQLLEQKNTYDNQHIHKNSKNTKLNAVAKQILDESLTKEYDSDSSSDSTNCSWWKNVYGFDMRIQKEFINDFHSKSSTKHKDWCIMPDPIITFFDPCKVVSNTCLIKEFNMYKCNITEAQHLECKDLKLRCSTPYASANSGDFGHMLEIFMVVDFPNGHENYMMTSTSDTVQIGFSTSCYSPFTRYRQTGLLLRDQLLVNNGNEFMINELHIWRGPQTNLINKLFDRIVSRKSSLKSCTYEQDLKIRLRYTFVNKYTKAVDRRCIYILNKHLY
ncbi:Protein arginine N-methyltransferase,S-adenosyl-L-methionine-dependent methyltransferase [Cinara cedri]|uniref:Protein arginine N-methyltransferase,S-adenosyl-L-methionine-dependent methyltransferase n=1 Tax=Cinara cedri TaxID=506608 RepID=A0A5E4NK93_9HEMI|nr:Protein arginine N-methyltransferase,S-adenosyl-L-methionine-dependent methyltransferase [Cinara cedri]